MPANAAPRANAKSTPTALLPPPCASSFAASASAFCDEFPTVNVNPPCTGWESAEMTRHVTTYAPVSRCGRLAATVWAGLFTWRGAPMSTRSPFSLNTAIEPNETSTFSLNVSSTAVGAVLTVEFALGLSLRSTA